MKLFELDKINTLIYNFLGDDVGEKLFIAQ